MSEHSIIILLVIMCIVLLCWAEYYRQRMNALQAVVGIVLCIIAQLLIYWHWTRTFPP